MKSWRWGACGWLCWFGVAAAQSTPEGLWATYNDEHTQVQSWVRIQRQGDVWTGRVDKVLDPAAAPDERCDACKGDKKGRPLQGLVIIEDVSVDTGRGGTILDPENGQTYRLELSLAQEGRELLVRGYWGPFWRTQRWLRLPGQTPAR
jgi:uncharacterized protein (DUF2147 family)